MSSHEEYNSADSTDTNHHRSLLTNGNDYYVVVEYSKNTGLDSEHNPITGATLEDLRTSKRAFIDRLSLLALEEIIIGHNGQENQINP